MPCQCQYPEPKGGVTLLQKEIDTARVQLKPIREVPKVTISNPDKAYEFLKEMTDYDRERFKIIYLDVKNRVLGVENISEGTINAALVHPREALKGAILANASGIILAHNHPSGLPEPSKQDNDILTKLNEAFRIMGIEVIDAMIVGKEGYYSYREAGTINILLKSIGETIMEDKTVKDDACAVAIHAAMSVIDEQCGDGGKEIDIGGVKIRVATPESVMQVMEEPLTEDQRILAIKQSKWAQNEATGLCEKLLGLVPETKDFSDCVDRVSGKLAKGMVIN